MDSEISQKAYKLLKNIIDISNSIDMMEERRSWGIIYQTDIFLEGMYKRHKEEATGALRTRKDELEKELAAL